VENAGSLKPVFADVQPSDVPDHRPALRSATEIADYLSISPELIRYVRRYKTKNYRSFEFTKRSGAKRRIDAPRTFLKVIQWWRLDTILSNSYVPEHVFGFVRGRSFIDNARAHIGAAHILNVDVQDFFPSIGEEKVVNAFQSLGYSAAVSSQLADITTLNGRLPQGAPTSPALANICFEKADLALMQIAIGHGLTYTRYADDLTFSSKTARIPADVLSLVQDALRIQGFYLNPKKTVFMGENDSKEVTGLVVGSDAVALPRDYLNRARGWFYKAQTNPKEHINQLSRIRGTLELIKQVGGRGSQPLILQGERAIFEIEVAALLVVAG